VFTVDVLSCEHLTTVIAKMSIAARADDVIAVTIIFNKRKSAPWTTVNNRSSLWINPVMFTTFMARTIGDRLPAAVANLVPTVRAGAEFIGVDPHALAVWALKQRLGFGEWLSPTRSRAVGDLQSVRCFG
jgi:hypothetical protein